MLLYGILQPSSTNASGQLGPQCRWTRSSRSQEVSAPDRCNPAVLLGITIPSPTAAPIKFQPSRNAHERTPEAPHRNLHHLEPEAASHQWLPPTSCFHPPERHKRSPASPSRVLQSGSLAPTTNPGVEDGNPRYRWAITLQPANEW